MKPGPTLQCASPGFKRIWNRGYVKIRETRHKISVDMRIFFTVQSSEICTLVQCVINLSVFTARLSRNVHSAVTIVTHCVSVSLT